ncbi:MAG: hypothetical protein H8E57_09300 [Candidatus Cloacimonetes bacterium]|nr:hypothetical protein [Candidatus Cloacimonadota bacterium]
MQEILKKYFWDGTENISDEYFLRRMLEYSSFPDLLKIPFNKFKSSINNLDIEKVRTSKARIKFVKCLLPYLEDANDWEEAIFMLYDEIKENIKKCFQ